MLMIKPPYTEEYFQNLSLAVIQNDCEALKKMKMGKNSIVGIGLIPYYSLFCKEVETFFAEHITPCAIQNGSPFSLDDTRAKLKLFNGKYRKMSRYITAIDAAQDEIFKSRLRFNFLKWINANYNLGIYFDEQSNIIGNTQYFHSMFQGKHPVSQDLAGSDLYTFGLYIGQTIKAISDTLSTFYPAPCVQVNDVKFTFYYLDCNTNRTAFFALNAEKSLELLLLHILGSINFALCVIERIIPDNLWKLRVQYICMYYAHQQLRQLSERLTDSHDVHKLSYCISSTAPIFNSDFRSCMMHYSFIKGGQPIIGEQYLNVNLPFFGLIETCFDGMSYYELQRQISANLQLMSDRLMESCVVKRGHLKKL